MIPVWWSVLLASVGIFGLWLAGRKSWTGWAVGLAAQLLWIAYAIATGQPGFILSALGYGAVNAINLRRWLAEHGKPGIRLPHIHRRRPVGPVYGPFALTHRGALGHRRYRCRCGREWEHDEYEPPRGRWRETNPSSRRSSRPAPPLGGSGQAKARER